jgi:protein SCO1
VKFFFVLFGVVAAMLSSSMASAQIAVMPKELEHVGVAEHLDGPLPKDAVFRDETSATIRFGQLLDGKRPSVLIFAYHSCPVLCSMVLKAAVKGLTPLQWKIGREYDLIVVSIDPKETLEASNKRRAMVLADYNVPGAEKGLHFLTGDQANIDRLTQAAGVQFEYDAEQQQYGHPAVITLLKPDGSMARYLYGLEFIPNDLRLGLLEASEGRSISTIEQLILYCYHYDPKGGKYVLVAWRVMRLGAGACGATLVFALMALWLRELRKRAKQTAEPHPSSATHSPASGPAQGPTNPANPNAVSSLL